MIFCQQQAAAAALFLTQINVTLKTEQAHCTQQAKREAKT
jgi:hypothetical protein